MPAQLPIKNKLETERLIKIAPFRKNVRRTDPHKHNAYLELIYLSQGSGIHSIDSIDYPIGPPMIHIIRQEQVHWWQLDSEPEGYVVIIRKAFFEKSLDSELKSLFTAISSQCCLEVEERSVIENLLELLAKENQANGQKTFTIIEGLLKALLAKVLEVAHPLVNRAELQPGLYQSFIDLLSLDQGMKKTIRYYADKLHVSPQNLNAACQRASNRSATEVLDEFVLAESKRLLLYTDLRIGEIAFALSFSDSSHFVKYFRRIVGNTPQNFRKANA